MKKRISIGILMFISVTFFALLIGYSAPISIDDDVGQTTILVSDDFYQPIIQDQFENMTTRLYIEEGRWNFPSSTTYNVLDVFTEPTYINVHDIYYENKAWDSPMYVNNTMFIEQIFTQPLNSPSPDRINSPFNDYGWEVLGVGELFPSTDVK